MHSPAGSGRVFCLVALLLAACYIADWSDDYASCTVSTQYSTFASANGYKPPISGSIRNDATLASLTLRGAGAGTSGLEAAFGNPIGSATSASLGFDSRLVADSSATDTDSNRSRCNQFNRFSGSSMSNPLCTGSPMNMGL